MHPKVGSNDNLGVALGGCWGPRWHQGFMDSCRLYGPRYCCVAINYISLKSSQNQYILAVIMIVYFLPLLVLSHEILKTNHCFPCFQAISGRIMRALYNQPDLKLRYLIRSTET